MKTKTILLFALVSLFLDFRFSAAQAAGPGAAEFRGYMKVNDLVRERLLERGSDFELSQYLGQSYDPFGTNLLDLLGTHKSGFAGGRFRNGTPNSLNMLIWHMLFSKLATDVSLLCTGEAVLPFSVGFRKAAAPFCEFPFRMANWDDQLFTLWLTVMNFDAPLTEYQEWRKFWISPQASALRGPEALEWMVLSIVNNPYFLLRL